MMILPPEHRRGAQTAVGCWIAVLSLATLAIIVFALYVLATGS